MPSLEIDRTPDTGEEVVSLGRGQQTEYPSMPPCEPTIYAWLGRYEMRMHGTEPVIVPVLVPYVCRPGVAGMVGAPGDLANTSIPMQSVERRGGVMLLHRSLPSYVRRRRVHSLDRTRPAYRHYAAWERMVQVRGPDGRPTWSIQHDEAAYVAFLLSLYPGGVLADGLVPYPTDEDLEHIRSSRQRREIRHINAVDARDALALATERAMAEREATAIAAIQTRAGIAPTEDGDESVDLPEVPRG